MRKTYVDFLRTSRKGRLEFEKQRILSKNKRKIPKTVEEIEMDPDLGMRSDLVKGAPLLLPTSKDGLFIKTSTGGIEGVALSRQFDPDRPHKN